ncbi:MAG: Anthranilate synthase component 2 [Lentisphaerae bacterium ADurb.Bin242]|nr:MAG: Anthranilate synthase component 2 [Lentisphaerae bacterium ADurb.Bin242]
MILLLDNYDSFTYNLAHLLYSLGGVLEVRRNREITVEEALRMNPEAIIFSPGPGRPETAGIMPALIAAAAGKIPMLGVCLGHQAIGQHFGAEVVKARSIMHGKMSRITNDGRGLFAGLRKEFKAIRYHSLALRESTLPSVLEVTARADDGEIMGVRHREFLIEGVQYHPESIMSSDGKAQTGNFLKMVDQYKRKRN